MGEVIEGVVRREYRSVVSDNRRWSQFVHRPDDIFVCTSPKCGTSWTQTIVTTLLFPDGLPAATVMDLSPWIDARFFPIEAVVASLEAPTHRPTIKKQTPDDGNPQ